MLTRRRFGAMAMAVMAVAPWRRAFAQSQGCVRTGRYGQFIIEAEAYERPKGVVTISLDATVQSNNDEGEIEVSYFARRLSHGTDYRPASLWLLFYPDGDDTIMGPYENGFYELYIGSRLVSSIALDPNQISYQITNDPYEYADSSRYDSFVRLGLGPYLYEWNISSFDVDAVTWQAGPYLVDAWADADAGRCKPNQCLLTTVACHTVGLPDDCWELTAVRGLRDSWLARQPFGPAALAWYYEIAPKILAAIPAQDRATVFARFYLGRLVPAVVAERLGLHRLAFRWLEQGVKRLASRHLRPV